MTFDEKEYLLNICKGVLSNNSEFCPGEKKSVEYRFDCPEYQELREKYRLERIAGKGGDLQRSIRLLHYFSPRLTHCSWYDNRIECNALRLLEYSLEQPDHGINCLNKAKILEECCLALGIYARRVRGLPYSPYDSDCHVVTEIYDRETKKWYMLDPTTNGCLVDDSLRILSFLEARQRFAADQFVAFWKSTSRTRDVQALYRKNIEWTQYYAKNLFRIQVDAVSQFGQTGQWYDIIPLHFSVRNYEIAYRKYLLRMIPEYAKCREDYDIPGTTQRITKALEEAIQMSEPVPVSTETLTEAPRR